MNSEIAFQHNNETWSAQISDSDEPVVLWIKDATRKPVEVTAELAEEIAEQIGMIL